MIAEKSYPKFKSEPQTVTKQSPGSYYNPHVHQFKKIAPVLLKPVELMNSAKFF